MGFDIKIPLYDLFYSRAGCNTGKRTSPYNSVAQDMSIASAGRLPVAFDADKKVRVQLPLGIDGEEIKIGEKVIKTTEDFVKYCLDIDYNSKNKVPRKEVTEGFSEPGEIDTDAKKPSSADFEKTNQRPRESEPTQRKWAKESSVNQKRKKGNTYFSAEQRNCIDAMKTKVMQMLNDFKTTGKECDPTPGRREFTN